MAVLLPSCTWDEKGPTTVAICGGDLEFSLYRNGILGSGSRKLCNCRVDHAVAIVGWGTNPRTSQEYWVIKNSFGESWGENGYGRVAIASGSCRPFGISEFTGVVPAVKRS